MSMPKQYPNFDFTEHIRKNAVTPKLDHNIRKTIKILNCVKIVFIMEHLIK